MTYQESEYVQLKVPKGIYDLNVGQPCPQLLPSELLYSADRTRIKDPTFLQYAANQGYFSFRKEQAAFLSSETGDDVTADELLITTGNSSAIHLIGTHIASTHNTRPLALVESPTYQFGVNILAACGFEIRAIPVDEGGIVVKEIERLLTEEQLRPALVFTIPSYQNPTGVNLRPERRQRLIQLADTYGFYILADEAYQLLSFPGTKTDSALAIEDTTEKGVVFTIGTFSKIFAPAIRLGWVQARPPLIQGLLEHPLLISGGGMNSVMAGWIEPLMTNGAVRAYLGELRQELYLRYQHLLRAVKEKLPEFHIITEPCGGYYLWCKLQEQLDSSILHELAMQNYHVNFRTGARCNTSPDYLRLCFAYHTPAEIDEGIRLLALAYEEYMNRLS
uniref:DNA-binding transcriptional regulator, MocR family, contains an aminotransferase domain n=1 Tax=Candidatus Kentrum sp. MB TaxID=2138164 RepID=A0A450XUZ5_9GAMM|nr:MAG: DNA-binding transcriptional regulator, MocR family, contains an aminotransferase domain [Candidatus Kentron sp. MB]VFK33092.1 MAG: DNA-binding transcriptional regulator, MocR family, contains an aminotransferase domain [Candidatus Kentron sp. MB]VFK76051.1 MAG: DNA-binding transcriptional regulator, MocR family, contains an aminotransferase domain [Candidatus Kentron sp. MB]